ncbi:MAG: NAD-dependent epimerase/dehydratase family protein [Proteobacteria bacterium]|nr:NAD-dependent epimerase/dehydratase family protein [Pseudomonadota bacterium]MDA1354876.1 NAD-dependent epimerase/dehydratase family protein [Pseudomonadota bacterium]
MQKILVTGALGQIGSELVPALRERYGSEAVIASGIRFRSMGPVTEGGIFEILDCTNVDDVGAIVQRHNIGTIYHLAAIMSAVGEKQPEDAWDLNFGAFANVLKVARQHRCAVFFPSSIGAFGPTTPSHNTPQDTSQRPTTIYGVAKVAGELLSDYYAARFDLDTRGIRLPGLISSVTLPGGGTTDYAVDIFYQAVREKRYTCFLRADSRLDMMYMPDAISSITQLMEADASRLRHRNAFNVTAISITPAELAAEIQRHIPDFVIDYDVDPLRQAIADSWPDSMDDSAARAEWDWSPRYDLAAMTRDMLEKIRTKLT